MIVQLCKASTSASLTPDFLWTWSLISAQPEKLQYLRVHLSPPPLGASPGTMIPRVSCISSQRNLQLSKIFLPRDWLLTFGRINPEPVGSVGPNYTLRTGHYEVPRKQDAQFGPLGIRVKHLATSVSKFVHGNTLFYAVLKS